MTPTTPPLPTQPCPACKGCGRVADVEGHPPWCDVETSRPTDVALGIVLPLTCGRCRGEKVVRVSAYSLDAERAVRDRTLKDLAAVRSGYLADVRRDVVALYEQRVAAAIRAGEPVASVYVTADDARTILEAYPLVPPPEQMSRNFLGAVFREERWYWDGQMSESSTEGAHARRVMCWRLRATKGDPR